MKKNIKTSKMKMIAVTAIILALALTATATIAYFTDFTLPKNNTFAPGNVKCEVNEEFTNGDIAKKNVCVENKSNIDVFIRVAVTVNWVGNAGTDNAGKVYGAKTPGVYTKDYTLSQGDDFTNSWFLGNDGYYYCKHKVAAGGTTPNVIDSLTVNPKNVPVGYHLEVSVMADAIQAEPEEAVESAWQAVDANGDTLIKK